MRLSTALLIAAFVLPAAPIIPAQTLSPTPPTRQSPADPPAFRFNSGWAYAQARACPVSLKVHHGAGLGQVVATDGTIRPASQILDLLVSNHGSQEIASIEAVVQTQSGQLRIMPAHSRAGEEDEQLTMTLGKRISIGNEISVSWNVASANPVQYVEIRKVTYKDGSIWTALKDYPCQFKPDPIMLISAR
jgi:hypothetical protein